MVDIDISDGACEAFGALLFEIRTRSPKQSAEYLLDQHAGFEACPSWLYAIERGEVRINTLIARNLQKVYGTKLRRNEDLVACLIELDEQPLGTMATAIRERHSLERRKEVPELGSEALGTGWGLQVGDLPKRDRQLVLAPVAVGATWIGASLATFIVLTQGFDPFAAIWSSVLPASFLVAAAFLLIHALEHTFRAWTSCLRTEDRRQNIATANFFREVRGLESTSEVWFREEDLPYLRPNVRKSYRTVAIRTDYAERLHGAFFPGALMNIVLAVVAAIRIGPAPSALWMLGLLLINILVLETLSKCADRGARQTLSGLEFGLGFSAES